MNKKITLTRTLSLLLCAWMLTGCTTDPQSAVTSQPTGTPTVTGTPAAVTQTAAPATTAASELMLAAPALEGQGDPVNSESGEDGTRREEFLVDGMVSVVMERMASVEYSQEAVISQIEDFSADARDMTAEEDAAVSARLSYPAWRITYMTGANEDLRTNVDIYIQTDDWDFLFHTSTPGDSYEEYSTDIEAWIASLTLTES